MQSKPCLVPCATLNVRIARPSMHTLPDALNNPLAHKIGAHTPLRLHGVNVVGQNNMLPASMQNADLVIEGGPLLEGCSSITAVVIRHHGVHQRP